MVFFEAAQLVGEIEGVLLLRGLEDDFGASEDHEAAVANVCGVKRVTIYLEQTRRAAAGDLRLVVCCPKHLQPDELHD